jgi:hypothetical protein
MHRWFVEYMQSELERLLPDPFEGICAMLGDGTAFSFSRFGDGEFSAIFGVEGVNSDGQRYFPELGQRLRQIVEAEAQPSYLMGLQTLAVMVHGARPIFSNFAGVKWVLADSLHNASMEGRLGAFFDSLVDREVLLVGAPHHGQLAQERSWQYVEIPYGDCWPQYESLHATLAPRAASEDTVFLFCASMTANVLIDDLHRLNPRNTYIDAGSVFDPYVGIRNRGYQKELSPNPLEGIMPSS